MVSGACLPARLRDSFDSGWDRGLLETTAKLAVFLCADPGVCHLIAQGDQAWSFLPFPYWWAWVKDKSFHLLFNLKVRAFRWNCAQGYLWLASRTSFFFFFQKGLREALGKQLPLFWSLTWWPTPSDRELFPCIQAIQAGLYALTMIC